MDALDVLFVAPVEAGSGETITVLHMADDLLARGHHVRFLASPFAATFLEPRFGNAVRRLTGELAPNLAMWDEALAAAPDAVVFSDYSLFAFPGGTSPLAEAPGWQARVEAADACMVTLDHFGFGQRETVLFPGPPHLGIQMLRIPAIPETVQIMLPCPMHEPGSVSGRRGEPFRYWRFPLGVDEETQRRVRSEYVPDEEGLLVFHAVPRWATRAAATLGVSGFYQQLPVLLDHYLTGASKPVTLLSVNNGGLFEAPEGSAIRIHNLSSMPAVEFERLLFSADLVLTENKISISLGKAICARKVSAVLRNSMRLLEVRNRLSGKPLEAVRKMERLKQGTVFPYEVFPTVTSSDLDEIALYRNNSITDGFAELEVFGGDATRDKVTRLLEDDDTRLELQRRQGVYADAVSALDTASLVLERIVERARGEA
jgi:hypothetical protein